MAGTYQKYPDVMTDADVDEMIYKQRRIEERRLRRKPDLTPYAIRCVRHGRVVLEPGQALGAMAGTTRAKCPHCGQEAPMDQFWYEHTKDRLWAF